MEYPLLSLKEMQEEENSPCLGASDPTSWVYKVKAEKKKISNPEVRMSIGLM